MFDEVRELELKQEYAEKVHQTAEANLLKRISQVKGSRSSILTRLLSLLRRPQDAKAPHQQPPTAA